MSLHQLYGQLAHLHQMLLDLFGNMPEADAYHRYTPFSVPVAWLFGKAVFRETVALREWIQGDDAITARVRPIFAHENPDQEALAALPPRDHLIQWATQVFDENLARLANPGLLPRHPAVEDGRLAHHILREAGKDYERILAALVERRIVTCDPDYQVEHPLRARDPAAEMVAVIQGHYRVGGKREDPAAVDDELPPQVVQLSNFRIAARPVNNAEFLAFINDGGYQRRELWSDESPGDSARHQSPLHWRQDAKGEWYGVSLSGPGDLTPAAPVSGIDRHEAAAYVNWLSTKGDTWEGAVLQHEYQWESAARLNLLKDTGKVWEWCANAYHAYDQFQPSPDRFCRGEAFDEALGVVRGGSIHSQPLQKRRAYRRPASPRTRLHFGGLRPVFPPAS